MNSYYLLISIGIMAAVTALTRFLPFSIFRGSKPVQPIVSSLGSLLPFAIMGMLAVYCLKDTYFTSPRGFIPELTAGFIVIFMQKWKHNMLISIALGTGTYMFMVQKIFY